MTGFPALLLRADTITAQGAFAEAQADFFDPDPDTLGSLRERLEATRSGVVAHFYMDPELQGLLYGTGSPNVHISDSLAMADRAIAMAEGGAANIAVLGVDFMAENVRAMLDAAGHGQVGVYRVRSEAIGCSLAESAEALAYGAYLERAAATPNSIHVVYINTSLRTKAHAHLKVPTITCTSSNVLRTILQTFAQEPEAHIWFGPDTYMGENLAKMLEAIGGMEDAEIAAIHPAHDRRSIAALRPRFHYFEAGNCVVHHMFGAGVVEQIQREYGPDTHVTAHLEVPGEMFGLALEASQRGHGVVGSTSDILRYIREQVAQASAEAEERRLRFILGTEAGMVTAIVNDLRPALAEHPQLTVEIIFPVASEAVAITGDSDLPVVPGVAGGEGCSTAGGCATCPFMKMNSIDALMDVLDRIAQSDPRLDGFEPRKYLEKVGGETVAAVGSRPILHMRSFQRTGEVPADLLEAARGKTADSPVPDRRA